MSEYRRFVSYVYAYTNGKKEKNTGFVKVESRAGSCKMQIRLQKIPQEEKALDIYAFVRRGESLPGIFLGKIPVRAGLAEGTVRAGSGRIGGKWKLDELAGIWLLSQRGVSYITVWDDLPVTEGQLMTGEMGDADGASPGAAEAPGVRGDRAGESATIGAVAEKAGETAGDETAAEKTGGAAGDGAAAEKAVAEVRANEELPETVTVAESGADQMEGADLFGAGGEPPETAAAVRIWEEPSGTAVEIGAVGEQPGAADVEVPGSASHAAAPPEESQAVPSETRTRQLTEALRSGRLSEYACREPEQRGEEEPRADQPRGREEEPGEDRPHGGEEPLREEGIRGGEEEPRADQPHGGEEPLREEGIRGGEEEPRADQSHGRKEEPGEDRPRGKETHTDLTGAGNIRPERKSIVPPEAGMRRNPILTQHAGSKQPYGTSAGIKAGQTAGAELRADWQCPAGLSCRWNCLSAKCAHEMPFEDAQIQDCIQISPKDTTALKRQNWGLGRNRFLQHGFVRYRKLLLIRLKNGTWLLGVPGTCTPQDRKTAAVYGFPQFLPVKAQADRAAASPFGYWCRQVE